MNFYYLMCYLIFIPSIHCSNATSLKTGPVLNNIAEDKHVSNNSTKNPVKSEIISTSPEKSVLTSKDNIPVDLLNLDEGFGKIKEKPVHARKGVDPLDDVDSKNNVTVDLNTLEKGSSIAPDKSGTILKKPVDITVKLPTELPKNNDTVTKSFQNPKTSINEQLKKNEKPKKPLKTVYETLASIDQGPATAKTSPHTLLLDQIPSPNRDSAGKNPGMITPIVITILVVPMFAVLGYMAIKRGQEAWKNRHYKRMDFLLDGMYND